MDGMIVKHKIREKINIREIRVLYKSEEIMIPARSVKKEIRSPGSIIDNNLRLTRSSSINPVIDSVFIFPFNNNVSFLFKSFFFSLEKKRHY